jgi:cell wall assembly regulator SMI1
MPTLEQIFAEIDARHYHEPCTDPSAIEALEDLQGHRLPDDLKAFYRRYKTVRLFDGEYGATYRFVPVSEIHPTRIDIYGEDTDEWWRPRTWLTICDVLDGNYIAIDIASKHKRDYNYINCFHETFGRPGESKIIARSFTELLERALRGGGNSVYYLQEGFIGYGDGRPLTPENAAIRIDNPGAPRKGWLVGFTFKGTPHHELFADDDYGGREQAFEAVRRYIEETSK